MPFMAQKLSVRKSNSDMAVIARQTGSVVRAAREFVRANKDDFVYGQQNISGDDFSDLLEPFGLPLGFIPQTNAGQKISLITSKTESDFLAIVILRGGNLSETKRHELMARIGPDAAEADNDGMLRGVGGWDKSISDFGIKPETNSIYILIPTDDDFSELVRRNSSDISKNKFNTNLNMGNFSIKNMMALSAKNAQIETANFGTLAVSGSSDDRRFKNKIESLTADKAVFQTTDGANALNIARGNLSAKILSTQSLFKYGSAGYVSADEISINSLSMSVGRTGFIGMYDWDIHDDVILNNLSIDTEHIEINGFINASRGQDVFIDEDELTYSTKSGIETETLNSTFITLRDQTSSALLSGSTGDVLLDIRPSGVSMFPDILSDNINNDDFVILRNPGEDDDVVVTCKNVISSLSSAPYYNAKSVSQNIVCQFVFWQRLERRINIKQCLINGGTSCE